MKLWRAILAAILLVPTLFIGITAGKQLFNYAEIGTGFFTTFHEFNAIILMLVAVSILVFAISVATDKFKPTRSFFDSYVRATLFATAGVVTFLIGLYENYVITGDMFPFRSNAYHWWDVIAVAFMAYVFFALAIYYLFRDPASDASRPAPEANGQTASQEDARSNEGLDGKSDFEIRSTKRSRTGNGKTAETLTIVRAENPSIGHIQAILNSLQEKASPRSTSHYSGFGGSTFGEPFSCPLNGFFNPLGISTIDIIALDCLLAELLEKREADRQKKPASEKTPDEKATNEPQAEEAPQL